MYENESTICSVVSDSLQPHGQYPARHLCPWNSPGKNTGVGCHSLTPGDLPNPGIKPALRERRPALKVVSSPFELPGKPFEVCNSVAFRTLTFLCYDL